MVLVKAQKRCIVCRVLKEWEIDSAYALGSFFTGLEGTAIQLEKASPEKAGSSRNPTFSVKPKNNSLEGSPSRDSGKKQSLNTSPSRQPRRSPVTQDNSKSCLTRDIFETSHSAESIKRKIENIFCSSQVSSNLPTAINQYHSLYQIEASYRKLVVFMI